MDFGTGFEDAFEVCRMRSTAAPIRGIVAPRCRMHRLLAIAALSTLSLASLDAKAQGVQPHDAPMYGGTSAVTPTSAAVPASPGMHGSSALPSGSLGADDLVEIMVPYCPELSHNFRVGPDGALVLPLLNHPIPVLGLAPDEVSARIKMALIDQKVLIEPIVNVTILESRSRTVSVVGAVARPLTFQATGQVTLLDAIAMAGGVAPNVGNEILVTSFGKDATGSVERTTQKIPTAELLAKDNPSQNMLLHGGEEIRVSLAGSVYVAGNVRRPGAYPIQGNEKTTVIKALALSEGVQDYASHSAYIYRLRSGSTTRDEIQVPLRKILKREEPDVFLQADDILYVPDSNGRRLTAKVLGTIAGFGTSTATGLLIYR